MWEARKPDFLKLALQLGPPFLCKSLCHLLIISPHFLWLGGAVSRVVLVHRDMQADLL